MEGISYFLGDCTTCQAYFNLDINDWQKNDLVREMLRKDLITDYSTSLFDMLKGVKALVF